MPELPEVETVRSGLAPTMEGATINKLELRRENLRYPFPSQFARKVEGARILSLTRRAKYLIAELDNAHSIIMHLGMSGSFRIEEGKHHDSQKNAPTKHDHVVFHLQNQKDENSRITYNDPRRFGFMDLVGTEQLSQCRHFINMGIEPLGNTLSALYLARLFHQKSTPLKAALLDQRLIAGLGNIYVCEILHRTGLSPLRKAGSLTGKSGKPGRFLDPLAQNIRAVLHEAILAGGSTLKDHRQADGSLGYFQHNFAVYGREGEPCGQPKCNGTIKRIVQSGRSTFYCPRCQR